MMNNGKAQVSIEFIAVLAIVLFLFALIMLQFTEKTRQTSVWEENYKKEFVCQALANRIVDAYTSGATNQDTLNLEYSFNTTIYGEEGLIMIGDDPYSVICTIPAGTMNHTKNLNSKTITVTNAYGQVEVEGA